MSSRQGRDTGFELSSRWTFGIIDVWSSRVDTDLRTPASSADFSPSSLLIWGTWKIHQLSLCVLHSPSWVFKWIQLAQHNSSSDTKTQPMEVDFGSHIPSDHCSIYSSVPLLLPSSLASQCSRCLAQAPERAKAAGGNDELRSLIACPFCIISCMIWELLSSYTHHSGRSEEVPPPCSPTSRAGRPDTAVCRAGSHGQDSPPGNDVHTLDLN